MLVQGQLTRVHASRELADTYIATARQRLSAVEAIRDIDPAGAFVLTYDATRLALAAILVNQGLRPRGEGAHALLLDVVLAQLERSPRSSSHPRPGRGSDPAYATVLTHLPASASSSPQVTFQSEW